MSPTSAEKKQIVQMLEAVPLFSSLNSKSLSSICGAATKRVFDADQKIVSVGEIATAFYLILEGRVEVRRGNKVISKLGKGQFFGEMALFDKEPRSADVVSVEKTTCLLLTSWALEGVLSKNWNVTRNVLKELASRLRATNNSPSE